MKGWDHAAHEGSKMMEALTERTDLKSGRAGWGCATKGTKKRVAAKMGKS